MKNKVDSRVLKIRPIFHIIKKWCSAVPVALSSTKKNIMKKKSLHANEKKIVCMKILNGTREREKKTAKRNEN
jgi:hypothetical protein